MRELGCELDGALVSVVSLVALTAHSAPSTAQPPTLMRPPHEALGSVCAHTALLLLLSF